MEQKYTIGNPPLSPRFNTTIVSVELITFSFVLSAFIRFNTTIVSVEQNIAFLTAPVPSGFNTTIVSVEPFLLLCKVLSLLFQYNYCFGGTGEHRAFVVFVRWFQYNYCFGGTNTITPSFSSNHVSIQLLFRWNYPLKSIDLTGINVSIQLLFRWNLNPDSLMDLYLLEFQYNYCFGGTY